MPSAGAGSRRASPSTWSACAPCATRGCRSAMSDTSSRCPATTGARGLATRAAAGATQVEPGHGLTGTTPQHAVRDLAELPAALYIGEISHHHGGRAYCYGGGMYVDPVFPPYQVRALVGRDAGAGLLVDATLPPPAAIDYYGQLDLSAGPDVRVGDSVVFGFRIQAFVTRAYTAGISGLA